MIKKSLFIFLCALSLCLPSYAQGWQGIDAKNVKTETKNFDGNLSSTDDNTVQKALDTLDDAVSGAVSDDAYSSSWDEFTTIAPSQHAVYNALNNSFSSCLNFIIDGHGAVISAGASGSKPVPYGCTITGWEIVSNTSGSAVIDIKRSTYTDWDTFTSIAGTEKPTLSAAQKNTDTSLTTWTTSLATGDRIQALVDSADINGVIIVTLYLTKT